MLAVSPSIPFLTVFNIWLTLMLLNICLLDQH